jgi:hypothetical protein
MYFSGIWSPLSAGLDGQVHALTAAPPPGPGPTQPGEACVYAAGLFRSILAGPDGPAAAASSGVARWCVGVLGPPASELQEAGGGGALSSGWQVGQI